MDQTININANITISTITTTEDRIKMGLQKFNIKDKKEWLWPLATIIAITVVICSADWKPIFGLPVIFWTYFWWGIVIICSAWLVYALICNALNTSEKVADEIISELRMETKPSN